MICGEIYKILNDPHDDGTGINDIADQFRGDRDASEILELLNSNDPELISIGAWILDEIDFEKYNKEEIILQLIDLCSHENVHVRYSVLGALYAVFERDKQLARAILGKLSRDEHSRIRKGAKMTAKSLSLVIE